jgi:hypothetical protein
MAAENCNGNCNGAADERRQRQRQLQEQPQMNAAPRGHPRLRRRRRVLRGRSELLIATSADDLFLEPLGMLLAEESRVASSLCSVPGV